MWPELWTRRLVTSPVTQTRPTSFSSSRFTCVVSSLTVSTRRVASVGNNSPKSHWDLGLRAMVGWRRLVRGFELSSDDLRRVANHRIRIRQRGFHRREQFATPQFRVLESKRNVDPNPIVGIREGTDQFRTERRKTELRIVQRVMLNDARGVQARSRIWSSQ